MLTRLSTAYSAIWRFVKKISINPSMERKEGEAAFLRICSVAKAADLISTMWLEFLRGTKETTNRQMWLGLYQLAGWPLAPASVLYFRLINTQKLGAVRPMPRPSQLYCSSRRGFLYTVLHCIEKTSEKSQFGKKSAKVIRLLLESNVTEGGTVDVHVS